MATEQSKKAFSALDAQAVRISIYNTYRTEITPDAPITPEKLGGNEFSKLVKHLKKDELTKAYKTLVIEHDLNQSTNVARMSNQHLETLSKYFDKVEIKENVQSLIQDIGVIYIGWWQPLNPTKKKASNNISLGEIQEFICRNSDSDNVINIVKKVGGNFSYKMKNYNDMKHLNSIKKAMKDVLGKSE